MKKIIIITICIVILLISSFTTYKVVKKHQYHLMEVTKKRIIEASTKCINQKKCDKYPITLETLYKLKYLEKEVNPVTKEYYNQKSYVEKKKNNLNFVIVD